MILRDYQAAALSALREEIMVHRTVLLQLPTGGGKTVVFSEITRLASERNNRVWIWVPRNELLRQSSKQLAAARVPHGVISAKSAESRAFQTHVVSKDTLLRRIKADKIKNWPVILVVDEAHLCLDQQLEVLQHLPAESKVIGVTATPERLDGRGLDEMYEVVIYGPTLAELVKRGHLANLWYFRVPGIEDDDFKGSDFSGTEVNADLLAEILKKRHIYGNVISHYREHTDRKPAIVFCRSVALAEETAARFRAAGYNFESIDGKMSVAKREALIDGVGSGRLHGITSCDLVTYGLDVPRIECIIMLRPTLSRALYHQMIGRGLRNSPGKVRCVVMDHVNNLKEHNHPFLNETWNFHGRSRRSREKNDNGASLKLCPKCFLHYEGAVCDNCGTARPPKPRPDLEEVDGQLVKIESPVDTSEQQAKQKREFREFKERIERLIVDATKAAAEGDIDDGAIGELLSIANELGYPTMWVYENLSKGMVAVNIPLLHEIQRQKKYKPGWIEHKKREIREGITDRATEAAKRIQRQLG